VSVSGGLKPAAAGPALSWPRWTYTNIARGVAMVVRPPRAKTKPVWRAYARLGIGALVMAAVIVAAMIFIDVSAIEGARRLPQWLVTTFNEITDFGRSGWFLIPIGFVLVVMAALASPALPRLSQLVLAAAAVRLAFVFTAIALPGLFSTIIKRVIGRGRPFVGDHADPFLYMQFVWRPDYASLPSGHATNAFAAAIAIGLIWPRTRPVMWIYALIIALSRVVITAHHPSDVIAGAFVGVVGALLVRDWFAARRLGFFISTDGSVHSLPGPSMTRIKKVARLIGRGA